MTRQVSITVSSSSSHPDVLLVQDVMDQIRDFFSLLSCDERVVWNLVSMSMNSPLLATAEAMSFVPDVNVDILADECKRAFEDSFEALKKGEFPETWADENLRELATNFFQRTTNGIGNISIDFFNDIAPVVIDFETASVAVETLSSSVVTQLRFPFRKELGSVEGVILDIGQYYRQPAIKIKERVDGSLIWCLVPQSLHERLSEQLKVADVWLKRDVIVAGEVCYNKNGCVSRVNVEKVIFPKRQIVQNDEIYDDAFTDGLSAVEYLNQLRG